ncbi:hypothetical protein ACM46_06850 [Chryseobacterium angstadtii]|uniref:Uncharacterized protein n=1 Tax=Chryseobacterium angstadtii TaxID=558151 RepID=A0A0J7IHY3_9FLAO|nr:hypothetical protein [Chryseobacterium angstadtii]KMQ65594.1 hypothetical protein ACM46_06850 [Chryseobacterium angstadtii]
MELKLENISVMYPDEDSSIDRDLVLRVDLDEESLHFDLIDKVKPTGGFALNKKEVGILRDYLTSILKNKIIN